MYCYLQTVIYLTICSLSVSAETTASKCPKGQIVDLNGKCVKKFVLPKREPCPDPDLRFGSFAFELGGRMVSFECEDGWTMAPHNDYAMCVMGKWDRTMPNCVRPGCRMPTYDEVLQRRLKHTEELDGAILRFECLNERSSLEGEGVLGCDGDNWNSTLPVCIEPTTTTTTTTERPKMSSREANTSGQGRTLAVPILVLCLFVIKLHL